MTLRTIVDVAAPAKLNLFLHVVGRRADGYHLLQSLFVPIDWCDSLHFERRDDGRLARHDLGPALPADDLCLRAARALQSASACPFGADISIEKRVPWGAGLGGGSSDAASTLLALNRLWGLGWSRARLMALGLALGADVPFFLGRGAALVEGIGERLTPVDFAPRWFAVVKPPAAIETRAIFASPLLVGDSEAAILAGSSADISQLLRSLIVDGRNDLQAAAEAECGQVAQAAGLLADRFGNSRMTGSGSAVFASAGVATGDVAPAAVAGVESADPAPLMPPLPAPDWAGRMCRSLSVHPLAGWAEGPD